MTQGTIAWAGMLSEHCRLKGRRMEPELHKIRQSQPVGGKYKADTYNGTVTGEVGATLTKVNGVATSGPKVIQAGEKKFTGLSARYCMWPWHMFRWVEINGTASNSFHSLA